ncbi:MAG TPA: hypothetical protein VGP87_07335 [Gemmatimonadales bacterium]|nr:hypothetical protein [Gemmatimonadales bacterium]
MTVSGPVMQAPAMSVAERPASPALPRRRGRLGTGATVLTGLAALLPAFMFVLPLWTIRLVAPQYPEGLGMHIRINTIEGLTPTDLGNINGLNHYIGMRVILPDAIPELALMPWILAGIIGLGVLTMLLRRRAVLLAWIGVYASAAIAGMADFWKWGYDYGHNLDAATAIIKVPGMSYQPPLLGSKQLLNFTATSWPASGGVLAGLSLALAVAAVVLAFRKSGAEPV